jgi:hypothetical protein
MLGRFALPHSEVVVSQLVKKKKNLFAWLNFFRGTCDQ